MIAGGLRARSQNPDVLFTSAAAGPELHAHEECPLPLLRRVQHRLGFVSRIFAQSGARIILRTIAANHFGVISAQASSLQPSVPEALVALAASP